MFGRLAALPMTLTRKPERRMSVQLFRQAHMQPWSDHTDHYSVMDYVI
jgi:hypothetical protein